MKVSIVITNPNHHVLITLPVARSLKTIGVEVEYISLCELRKFKTPDKLFTDTSIPFHKFDIKLPKGGGAPPSKPTKLDSIKSSIKRFVFWHLVIRYRLKSWLAESTHVVMLNDTAYPGNYIIDLVKKHGKKSILMQEGIRFPLPVEVQNSYGSKGADFLFAWGQKSAGYFEEIVAPNTKVIATGSPGFDKSLFIQQSLDSVPSKIRRVAIFGNPIDDQQFVTNKEKIALYIDLARTLIDFAQKENRELEIVFKNHPRESPELLRDLLQKNGLENIKVYESNSDIDIVINTVDAGIVFASTVGVNVILHGKKLAVVKLKEHGYLGDYVQDQVAYGLNIYHPDITKELEDFLSGEHYYFRNYREYLAHFATNAGESGDYIANLIKTEI